MEEEDLSFTDYLATLACDPVGIFSGSFCLESKVKATDWVVGGHEGQRSCQDSFILKGKQYEVFLFEQQGEPEHCLGKASEVRHVVAGTPSLVGGGERRGLEPGQWTDIPEIAWARRDLKTFYRVYK